ncbi:hypothetical protein [Rhodococcus sp. NPDC060176]|uniref:hypothetical protein n=1 Tax=Rhodococcus sp. NPDC060176 TaxID=3347062 RepID=UPI0036575624
MHLASVAWQSAFINTWGSQGSSSADIQRMFLDEVANFLKLKFQADGDSDPILRDYFGDATDPQRVESSRIRLYSELPRLIEHAVGVVGLLHDLGHPPFSHLLEEPYEEFSKILIRPEISEEFEAYKDGIDGQHGQFHEFAGKLILEQLKLDKGVFKSVSITLVDAIFSARSGGGWATCLHELIDGQMDVDRLDYIRRDSLRAGTEYHSIDVDRLIDSTELHRRADQTWAIGIGARGLSAVESLLLQRAQSYRWVIHNSRAIISDACLQRAFSLALSEAESKDASLCPEMASRPDLDYVSNWKADGSKIADSYYVDDSTVTNWLRSSRRGVNRVKGPRADQFEAYMAVADESSTNYRSAWRTYGELHVAIDRYLHSGTPESLALQGAITSKDENDEKKLGFSSGAEGATEVSNGTSVELFNQLVHRYFRALNRSSRALENSLNSSLPAVDGKHGVWVVSYVYSLKAYNKEKTKLWIGDIEYYLEELSPIPAALIAAEKLRPVVWPYFVTFSDEMPTRSAVANAFIGHVVELYKLIEKPTERS